MIKKLCMVSYPRTGSNRICEVVKSIPSVNGKYEIFHPENAWGVMAEEIDYINSTTGSSFRVVDHSSERKFTKYRQQNPSEFLELISQFSEKNGGSFVFFKIFKGHLSMDKFLSLMSSHELEFVFLTRNTIESYISLVKTNVVKKYNKVDTTTLTPKVSSEGFLGYQEEMLNWYCSCFLLASQYMDPVVIRYEDIFNEEGNDVSKINEALLSFNIGSPAIEKKDGLKRQDLTEDWRGRVFNPDVLENLLSQQRIVLDVSEFLKLPS